MAFVALSRLAARRSLLCMKQSYFLPQQIAPALQNTNALVQKKQCSYAVPHDDKNMALGRPLSPHLTVYKFEITMALSIIHRITGCVLGAYCTAWAGVAVFAPHDISYYINFIDSLNVGAPAIVFGKFVLGFPFIYHMTNGIRHLTWDTATLISKQGVWTTGIPMCLAVAATMAAVLFM